MSADALVAQLAAQRLHWVDVQAPVRVQLDTPSQFRAGHMVDAMRSGDGDALIEHLVALFKAWEGVTESDLLGAGVGGDGKVPNDPRLLRIMLADRPGWASTLAIRAVEFASEASKRIKAQSGK